MPVAVPPWFHIVFFLVPRFFSLFICSCSMSLSLMGQRSCSLFCPCSQLLCIILPCALFHVIFCLFMFYFLISCGPMFEFGTLRPTQSNSCLTLQPLQSKSTLVRFVHLVHLILQLQRIYNLWLNSAVPLLLLSKFYRWLYLALDYHPDKKYLLFIRHGINHNSPESMRNFIFKLRNIFTSKYTFILHLRDDI